MRVDLETTYSELNFIHDESYWQRHIYKTVYIDQPGDFLECSFYCRNVEKPVGCDIFIFEVVQCYKSSQSISVLKFCFHF